MAQINFCSDFIKTMQVRNINFYSCNINRNTISSNSNSAQLSFEARNPIDLVYILSKHSDYLPERVLLEAKKLVKENPQHLPTLKEVHLKAYSPLRECKTLQEAQEQFPEFRNVLNANEVFPNPRGNIKKLHQNGVLNEDLTLRLLREFWCDLKTQDEIAKELGLRDRAALGWVLKKINFVSGATNYKTLIKASDPDDRAVIAAKTTAWNALHPDLMRAHNKHAAQGTKTESYRKQQSVRIKEYDVTHPERKQKISNFGKEVWARIPEVRAKMSEFMQTLDDFSRSIVVKKMQGIPLSEYEGRVRTTVFKKFWAAYPDCLEAYRKACQEVSASRKNP